MGRTLKLEIKESNKMEMPKWVQNKINKLEQKKLIVRPDVANNIQREIDQLNQKYVSESK